MHGDRPCNNIGMGCHALLQGTFPIQGSNPGLLHCRWFSWIIYQLSHQESPIEVAQSCPTLCDPMDCTLPGFSIHGIPLARILEWAAMLSSRGPSQSRDQISVSSVPCIGRWVFSPLAPPVAHSSALKKNGVLSYGAAWETLRILF